MSQLPGLITDLALILVVAGIVTILFKKLRQPLVLGYIVAGFLVSPHMPYIPSVIDHANIKLWADIGVIFLLFSMGLDFSFKRIMRLGMSPFIAVSFIVASMAFVGYSAGRLFGWTHVESIFIAAIFSVCSSTTIIYKTFNDLKLKHHKFTDIVMSVLVLEDVTSIIMMVILPTLAVGSAISGWEFAGTISKIFFFIILWFVVGIFVVPLFLRRIRQYLTNEILVIISLALCFLMSVLSASVGFSSAFGAFVMGSILSETIEGNKIIRVVDPIKDLFGAIFFVSVGMLVEVGVLIEYALPILAIVCFVILGQAIFGTMGFLFSGQSLKTSMRCSFSMAQIGEFPFIIATLGLSLGVIGEFIYPVIVAGSALTTFLTPYIIKSAVPTYNFIEKHLPKRWVKTLHRLSIGEEKVSTDNMWKSLMTSMLYITLINVIVSIGVIQLMLTFALPLLQGFLPDMWANVACGLLTLLFVAPFLRMIISKPNHSDEFKTLWTDGHRNRLPLLFTVLVRIIICVILIFYTSSKLTYMSNALLISVAVALIIPIIMSRHLKQRGIKMERLFIQNLRSKEIESIVLGNNKPVYANHLLDRNVHISIFEIPEDSRWVGQQLKELHLRAKYGVNISGIIRGRKRLNIPDGNACIFPYDKVEAIGTDDQLKSFSLALSEEVYGEDIRMEDREMKLEQIVVTKNCPFVGKTLVESGIRDRYNCLLVGIDEGNENLATINPDRRFAVGDIIWLVGERAALRELRGGEA
ncbi:MAG: cation:proton antiporter [Prevotellaceae bacterium]|nr:cation:proton antiporter [Prevotellaceae bacterium]MDY3364511.1 cation:proton antiporter [Prevotella sp.]